MRTLLTFDYEIFFGARTGSVARCLLEPTAALAELARRHRARFVFFVDAAFLARLREEGRRVARLRAEHDAIRRQLAALARDGHELQLHVHAHWEDCRWNGDGWTMDLRRYALHAFAPRERCAIVARDAAVLRDIAQGEAAFAFRAGGWVLQPFAALKDALAAGGVTIESSVFAGGLSRSAVQPYDFRRAPAATRWRFEDDPLVPCEDGTFLEVPIASCTLPPAFFWRLALLRKARLARHRPFGDGTPVAMEQGDLLRKLVRPTASVVSLDGPKAALVAGEAARRRARGDEDFVVIGHPKALTRASLDHLDRFLAAGAARETCGYAAYRDAAAPRWRRCA